MNNPFDYTPDEECNEAFRKLLDRLETLKKSDNPDDVNFTRELETGKMHKVYDGCRNRRRR